MASNDQPRKYSTTTSSDAVQIGRSGVALPNGIACRANESVIRWSGTHYRHEPVVLYCTVLYMRFELMDWIG